MPRLLYLTLALLSLIWGGSFLFIKVLLHDYHPWSIAFLRSGFGVAAILVIMAVLRQPLRLGRIPWKAMTVVGLLNTAIPWALIGFSETRLSSSMASVLNATTPLWTMLVGVAFFQLRAARRQWLGMAIGFVGLLVLLDINPARIVSVDLAGFAGMITATLCYAISSHVSKRHLNHLTMYQVALGTLIVGCIGSGLIALLSEPFALAPLAKPANLLSLVGIGVFGSGVAYILFYYLIIKGSPEFATTVTYLVPVTAILWGFTLLHEEIHATLLAGLACILFGVYWAGRKRSDDKVRDAA